jgi:uncharacterized membrane-anchored protein
MVIDSRDALTKVPAVTIGFWIIKILATTLGETGGDSVSMTWLGETTPEAGQGGMNGYLVGTVLFGVLLLVLVWAQIRSRRFNPWLYWATIVASTTVGTTLADFCTRSLGIGYPGGSLLLFACVLASLFAWYRTTGTISVDSIVSPREEIFYWITITFSQTLGTALGDCSIMRRASATFSCSGRPSSSPARSARRWATFSTSRSIMAAWRSAARSPRWRSSC